MTESELKKIISQGKTSTVQFKERIADAYKLGTELVAFSNTKGGMLIIGVNDKTGMINGLSFEELQGTTNLLANAASENIKPGIIVLTETVATQEGNVMVVSLKEGADKPYKDNKAIIWVKNASDKRKVFSNAELSSLMQSTGSYRPDSAAVPGSSVKDLSEQTVKSFLMKRFAVKCKEHGLTEGESDGYSVGQIVDNILPGDSLEKLLQNLDLIKPTGELTLACLLLLGKRPQKYRPVFTIKCISFGGNDVTVTTFRDKMDDAELEGDLRVQYNAAMAFLKRNLHTIQIVDEFNSLGELEVPYTALVEVLVNALVHRDYAKASPIRLFIFDNRIELISPGNLPDGLTEEQVKSGASSPRNELLFSNAIYLLPYTGAGSGIRRALSLFPSMLIRNDELRNEFIITLPRQSTEENVSESEENVSESGEDVSKSEESVSKSEENVSESGEDVSVSVKDVSDSVKDVSVSVKDVSDSVKDVSVSVKDVSDLVKDVSVSDEDVSSIINSLTCNKIGEKNIAVLQSISREPKDKKQILLEIGSSYQTYNVRRYINSLIEINLIQASNNKSLSSKILKLEITEKGKLVLQALNKR